MPTRTRRGVRLAWATALSTITLLILIAAAPAGAQYFGRNKVQYRDFDFKVQKTEHFDIYYYPEERALVESVALMAERWYARLSELFGTDLRGKQPLLFYASGPQFRQTNAVGGQLGEGTGGVTEGLRRRIVMPSAGGMAETNHVLGHELVHAFQFDLAGPRRGMAGLRLPLWAVEGFAEYLSVGPVASQTAMWLRDSVAHDDLPTVDDLRNPRFFPYRYGHAFWAYVGGRWGDEKAVELFKKMLDAKSTHVAISETLGMDADQLSEEWTSALRNAYGEIVERKKKPGDYGPLLVGEDRLGGELNVGPALSPDGNRIVFLSERDLFSVDLYLADLETGNVRKLASTATDPHFDSLQFIDSAGDWDPDGRHFVQAAVRRGRGALVIFDTRTGDKTHEIVFDDLAEVHTPSYSPDGTHIVFSALQGGLVDLWTYEPDTGRTTRLTDDHFAYLQPVYAPDGGSIVFTTDRFSLDFETLSFGNYSLGRLDLATSATSSLPSYAGARHTNPQFSPDGRDLYFVSDVSGAANVHRLALDTGLLTQVTDLRAGVAGITPLSPSLSVARGTGRVAYTAREDNKYSIYALDGSQAAAQPVQQASLDTEAVTLPPREKPEGEVVTLLESPRAGLPDPRLPSPEEYRPGLGLEYVGRPSIGVGVSRYGNYVGGGASLHFSDMLGNRNLGVAIETRGQLQDIGGAVTWTDLTHRLDWGVGVQHIPYIYAGGLSRTLTSTDDGQPIVVERYEIRRQYSTMAFTQAVWALNRSQRFELQAAAQRFGFSREIQTDVFSLDGRFLGGDDQNVNDDVDSLYLGSVGGAFVHDTSIFGATSPLQGSRARFEVTPTFGSLDYTDVLADARKYVFPFQPLTVAFRATHFGRYGPGSEDERVQTIYLGYPELLRGYDGITVDECEPTETSPCPVFDSLFGSRIALGSAELRAPLLGIFTGGMDYGPIPMELALFADAGVAWTSSREASFLGGERDLLTSAGAALRVNVLGFLIVQGSVAHPFQRPREDWVWQLSFTPGF